MDEIPEALRDEPAKGQKAASPLGLGLILTVGGFMSISLAALIVQNQLQRSQATPPTPLEPGPTAIAPPTPTELPAEDILGHLPYPEAPLAELVAISSDSRLRLRRAAAAKFVEMQAAAGADSVRLVPISAFRTIAEQQDLFFRVKEQRNQTTSQRAEVSAPPNYSEHHTGYAIDIGDGRAPATNLNPSFENTGAFAWLEKNAAKYSFELSFPQGNLQGVNYEPWHWRFVGDLDSLETFYKARNLKAPLQKQP
ncbi:MAG: D-alanyl-D-alanine carboxypeptidase family protein [Chloroflexaceae bacterium]|nr:D-alanyl-D-alanine carboxypeptidase family protein [Chloroflexaceae bacterium]